MFGFFNRYENKALLDNYKASQYGAFCEKPYTLSESFYQTLLTEFRPYLKGSMLDVGCALGRLVFEYEKMVPGSTAIGIDTSKQFIRYCEALKAGTEKIGFTVSKNSNAQFIRGDIVTYPFLHRFNIISCVNVIDRVQNPQEVIDRLHSLLSKDGMLLLVDPYDWEMSPARSKYHVSDMKTFLHADRWEVVREMKDIPYVIPISSEKDREYTCHLLIVKRK